MTKPIPDKAEVTRISIRPGSFLREAGAPFLGTGCSSKIISGAVLCLAVILGVAPAAGQNDGELRQCVANLQASLHGRSILGPRGTAAYIQARGRLENQIGITEYDVLVSHCQAEIYRRHANQLPQQPRTQTAKRRR
jgi:hypothetical protein